MILDSSDYALVQDYIHIIKKQELVFWEGKMVEDFPKDNSTQDELFIIISLLTLLLGLSIATFLLHIGLTLMVLAMLIGYFSHYLKSLQEHTRKQKLNYTQYIITSKRFIFITEHQQKIHINSLYPKEIKKMSTHQNSDGELSIFFITQNPPKFHTYYYYSNQKTPFIGFINIGNAQQKVLSIIKNQLFLEP